MFEGVDFSQQNEFSVNVTPEVAESLLEKNEGNRALRYSKVKQYATDMRNGDFPYTGDPVRFDWNGRLIDGQHRLSAVVFSGQTIKFRILTGLDPAIQSVLDQGAKRTLGDALAFNDLPPSSQSVVKYLYVHDRGGNLNLKSANRITTTEYVKYAETLDKKLLTESVDFGQSLKSAPHLYLPNGKGGKSSAITPSVSGFLSYVLTNINGKDAAEFFHRLKSNPYGSNGDPVRTLVEAVQRRISTSGTGEGQREQIALSFKAWNAFRTNKPLKLLRLGPDELFPTPK